MRAATSSPSPGFTVSIRVCALRRCCLERELRSRVNITGENWCWSWPFKWIHVFRFPSNLPFDAMRKERDCGRDEFFFIHSLFAKLFMRKDRFTLFLWSIEVTLIEKNWWKNKSSLRQSLDFLKLKKKKKKKLRYEERNFSKKPWHRALLVRLLYHKRVIPLSNFHRCRTILCTFLLPSMNGNGGTIDFARKEEDRKEALTFVSTPMIY